MRAFTVIAALASFHIASARIVGIAAPSVLSPNTSFQLTLLTENYIQSVADIAVAWGFQLPTPTNPTGSPYTVGFSSASSYLGPDKSNTLQNITIVAPPPIGLNNDAWLGKNVVLSAGVYSLYGVSGGPTVTGWNVTVRIGQETGKEMVRSQGQGWIENGSC